METINYKELDPLCIPCIKILREKLNIETLFCCQGSVRGIQSSHSKTGYITCRLTDEAEKIILQAIKEVTKRDFRIRLYIGYNFYNGCENIIVRFLNLPLTERQLKYYWITLEKVLESLY